jgi:hypothetical protein
MTWTLETTWQPTRLIEVAGSVDTSTGATEVMTDAGRAYIKPLGNRQGPHVLATDWVGTHLAKWFGLSTFDIAILQLDAEDDFELPRGARAIPGPAFASKALAGAPWGESGLQLEVIINPDDITRLIIFDTWTLNCDRHHHDLNVRKPNPDNVFLSSEGVAPGRRRLIAMDHGLCFIRSGEDLTTKLAHIEKVKDEHVYGMFGEFRERLQQTTIEVCCNRLKEMNDEIANAIVSTVPREWEVPPDVRVAWSKLIHGRAHYVTDNVGTWIEKAAPWFGAEREQE